jgi:hypothetical protein
MNRTESIEALRRANPRARAGFAQAVAAAGNSVHARIDAVSGGDPAARREGRPRHRLVHVSTVGVALALVAAVAAVLTIGSPGGRGVEDATAAIEKAAVVTAASADHSGTAVVRIMQGGELWAGTTVRWNGGDVSVSSGFPTRLGRVGAELLVVDGVLYGIDPGVPGGWIELGDPRSIDPDSGTTPAEYLAAVREDVRGDTLRRLAGGVRGLRGDRLENGSTVYSGTVAAGLIARESGFKEGQHFRVLPFGFVAYDEASDPVARLDAALTVGPDDILHEIAVSWGQGASAWTYTVTYSGLGTTPAPAAPENAQPLVRDRLRAAGAHG